MKQLSYKEWLKTNNIKSTCDKCNGYGHKCYECHGRGIVECPTCGSLDMICENCDGVGIGMCKNKDCDSKELNEEYETMRQREAILYAEIMETKKNRKRILHLI